MAVHQWCGDTTPKYLSCVTLSSKDLTHTHTHAYTDAVFNSASSVPIHANTGTQHDSIYAQTQTRTHKSLILLIWSNRSLAISSIFHWVLASYLELTLNLNIESFMRSGVLNVAVFSGNKVQPLWETFDVKRIIHPFFFLSCFDQCSCSLASDGIEFGNNPFVGDLITLVPLL